MKRFLLAALFVTATAGAAAADDPILEPYAPFKLVGMMPETGQILFYSDAQGAFILAKMGDNLDGWRVSGIDPKSLRVSLQREDLIDDLELVRLPRPGSVIVFKDPTQPRVPMVSMAAPSAPPAPAAPSMAATVPDAPPAAPVAPMPPSTMTSRPATAADGIAPTVIDARPPAPQAPAAAPHAPPAPQVPATPPAPPPPPKAIEETHTLSRADVDREINDFDNLMTTVKVAPADGGGFVIVKLQPKSWIARIGFKQGDVVRTIAGEEISTVEDAARLYARLRSADSFSAEVDRGPQRVVLNFEVK